jgi:hypothetical protein
MGDAGSLGGTAAFGPGCSFTSLGTTTPFPVSGTAGRPASAAVSSADGVCGGGSFTAVELHPHNHTAPASAMTRRSMDLLVIPET